MDCSEDSIIIDSVFPKSHLNSNILVKFENSNIKNVNDINIDVFGDEENPGKKLLVALKKDKYFYGMTDSSKEACQTCLLIRKRKKNSVKIIPTSSCNLQFLDVEDSSNDIKNPLNTEEALKVLAESFGSKRLKRASTLKSKIASNAQVSEEYVSKMVTGINIEKESIADWEESEDIFSQINKILPPGDRNATKMEDVYNIDLIITKSERENLKDMALFMLDNPPSETDNVTSFFLSYHYKLLGNKLNVEKMELMLYADSLLRFFNMHVKSISSGSVSTFCPYSDFIGRKILNEFMESWRRPAHMINKTVCYILVLILFIGDFTIHMNAVSSCFKGFSIKKLMLLLRFIGAVPESKKTKDKYILKLPLPALVKGAKLNKKPKKQFRQNF